MASGNSIYARFIDPGTDPLWMRCLFWLALFVCVGAYLMECYYSGGPVNPFATVFRQNANRTENRLPKVLRVQKALDAARRKREREERREVASSVVPSNDSGEADVAEATSAEVNVRKRVAA